MEKVTSIEKILRYAIKEENIAFVKQVVEQHNPIDILVNDIHEHTLKEIAEWSQCRMLDTIYCLLESQGLLDEVKRNAGAIVESYSLSNMISKTAYDYAALKSELDTTRTILFCINLYYRS